ncbi:MAG: hypothetical protein JXQ67_08095 [Campylobacterales bacterium]|nr:hypothetical protein [Campylobacterales bacterium]
MRVVFYILLVLVFLGCSKESEQSSPFIFSISKTQIFSGETQSATLSLNSLPASSYLSAADTDGSVYSLRLYSSNNSVLEITPSTCTLSPENPSCDLQIISKLSHEVQKSVAIDISAEHNENVHHLATLTSFANGVKKRSFLINNQCPFDVWLEGIGASAAQVGCSPSTGTNYQSNCPEDELCLYFSQTKSYCVNASVIDENTTAPIMATDINVTYELNSSACSGGMITDISSPIFGQCTCSNDSQCALGQKCQPSGGTNQCAWDLGLDNFGKISKHSDVNVLLEHEADSQFAASGSMFVKLGCDGSGERCLLDNKDASLSSPTTFIEYTLATKSNDYYDISNINGATIPVSIRPIVSQTIPFYSENNGSNSFADNPYWCSVAGGTSEELLEQIEKTKKLSQGFIPLNTLQESYGCKNDFDTRLSPAFTLVSPEGSTHKSCQADSDCIGSSQGSSCGITSNTMNNNIDANNTKVANLDRAEHYECGHIVGYASLTQLCGLAEANSSYGYFDSEANITCSTEDSHSIDFINYALCEMHFISDSNDTGPARSCFNTNQTAMGDTCCGYSTWNSMPSGVSKDSSDAAVSGVDTNFWVNNIQPYVETIKDGCPTAYSYQYDDIYSTFVCQAKDTDNENYLSYQITLCDGGDTGGVSLPAIKECSLDESYSTITEGDNTVFVPAPAYVDETNSSLTHPYDLAVYGCSDTSTCSDENLSKITVATPNSGPVYTEVYNDTNASYYYVLGKNRQTGRYQGCMFEVVAGNCLSLAQSQYNSIGCEAWTLPYATNYIFSHRQIAVPAFGNGTDLNPFPYNPF